ncbi:MAG: hypothetical protein ACI9EW_002905, partial [Cellvibrionaceae bacterium]
VFIETILLDLHCLVLAMRDTMNGNFLLGRFFVRVDYFYSAVNIATYTALLQNNVRTFAYAVSGNKKGNKLK